MRFNVRPMVICAAALIPAACAATGDDGTEDVTVAQMSDQTSSIVKQATLNSLKSAQGASQLEALPTLFDGLGSIFDTLGMQSETASGEAGAPAPKPARAVANEEETNDDLLSALDEGNMDANAEANHVERILQECIFVDGNMETVDGTSMTLLIRGEVVCNCDPDDDADPPSAAELAECIADVDAMQIRLQTTLVDEGSVDASLLVSADRFNPLTLRLRPQQIALDANLGDILDTVSFIDGLMGDDDADPSNDEPAVPDGTTAAGTVRASLTVNGADDVTVAVSVINSIQLGLPMDGDVGTLNVTAAVADPLVSLRAVGGATPSVALSVDVNAVDIDLPWAAVVDDNELDDLPAPTGTLQLHLAGLEASISADATTGDALTVAGIGFGDDTSWVKKDGITLLALDLNANAGRHFDLMVTPYEGDPANDADDTVTIAVDPAFDLAAYFGLASVQGDIEANNTAEDDPIPEFLLDQDIGLSLNGNGGASVRPVPEADASGAFVSVVTGTFTLSSQPTGGDLATLSASAGQCLYEADEPVGDPLVGSFAVAGCQQ